MKREATALAFAMTYPSVMAAVYLVALSGGTPGESGSRAVQVVYGVSKFLQFLFPVLFLVWFDRQALKWPSFSPRLLGLGLLFGAIVGGLVWSVANVLGTTLLTDAPRHVRTKVAEFGVASPARYLFLAAFISVLHSLLEEYYWRWFVYVRLRKWMTFAPAAALSGLAFMGHHVFVLREYMPDHFWSAALPLSLLIAVGGFFWAWLFERSGSLLSPWLSHMLVDAALMWVGYQWVFGEVGSAT